MTEGAGVCISVINANFDEVWSKQKGNCFHVPYVPLYFSTNFTDRLIFGLYSNDWKFNSWFCF